jgi:hypothetical protein
MKYYIGEIETYVGESYHPTTIRKDMGMGAVPKGGPPLRAAAGPHPSAARSIIG